MPGWRRFVLVCIGMMYCVAMQPGHAESTSPWLTNELVKSLFPNAWYAGPISGEPPAAPVYGAGKRLGYVFGTADLTDTVGFSGAPFNIAVGLDSDGVMTGARVIAHAEPILNYNSNTGVIAQFIQQYRKLDYTGAAGIAAGGQPGDIDGISTATISARAFNHAIVQSARSVARSRGLNSGKLQSASVDLLRFEKLTWKELVSSGAVQHITVSVETPTETANDSEPRKPVVGTDIYVALLTPVSIGRNLVTRTAYRNYVMSKSPNDLTFALMSRGPYSFVGKKVFDTGIFERIHIEQGGEKFPLVRERGRYHFLPFLVATDAPQISQIGIFSVPADDGINVLKPWNLVLSATEADSAVGVVNRFNLKYEIPERFVLPAALAAASTAQVSEVRRAWDAQADNVAILLGALCVLVLALTFMGPLTRRPRVYRFFRLSFLVFTLVWIGWIAGAQLSVINPIGWAQALLSGAGIAMLLSDPLLLVLTVFVIGSFFVWGRGVFCGWLCPFGALQELLATIARWLRLPQISVSYQTMQTLQPIRYVALAAVIGAALHAPTTFGLVAEVEPFKTAISLRFDRTWPFVAYAIFLLVCGLFVERAFCRFLCPLGALLTIGGKLRLYNPLERRVECGSPCQLCTHRCPVKAIAPSGKIDMDECFYCLDCQVIYQDDQQCPPLVNQRRRVMLVQSN